MSNAAELMSPYQMAYPPSSPDLTAREEKLANALSLMLSIHCMSQGVPIANSRAGITGQAIELLESIGYEVRG
jgi:hypothetical protein